MTFWRISSRNFSCNFSCNFGSCPSNSLVKLGKRRKASFNRLQLCANEHCRLGRLEFNDGDNVPLKSDLFHSRCRPDVTMQLINTSLDVGHHFRNSFSFFLLLMLYFVFLKNDFRCLFSGISIEIIRSLLERHFNRSFSGQFSIESHQILVFG